ncbi:hypothetical protein HMPREF1546_01520 [Oscillibacter sp. KLE 1745]|nr:hypothetical protein HMPREF1546_01520 [Oscillibacter sp. KLE 1745]
MGSILLYTAPTQRKSEKNPVADHDFGCFIKCDLKEGMLV